MTQLSQVSTLPLFLLVSECLLPMAPRRSTYDVLSQRTSSQSRAKALQAAGALYPYSFAGALCPYNFVGRLSLNIPYCNASLSFSPHRQQHQVNPPPASLNLNQQLSATLSTD
jgi:hypothetical protein